MLGHRWSLIIQWDNEWPPESDRIRTRFESESNRIAKDCKGLERIAIRAVGIVPRHAPTAGPRMWFLVWNDLPGRACRGASLQCIRPLAAVTLPGLISKVCIVTTVYILIMGSIRSFDGRNCDWLSKAELSVSFRRNPTGFEADSNRNRIGIESESNRTQIQYFIYIK